ncbi:unnamed protein product [Amoebophrya sp. A120]|nr:unnamed protein product [Amoebophrya sp. A120]|eukprot:GSA120T00002465001.1
MKTKQQQSQMFVVSTPARRSAQALAGCFMVSLIMHANAASFGGMVQTPFQDEIRGFPWLDPKKPNGSVDPPSQTGVWFAQGTVQKAYLLCNAGLPWSTEDSEHRRKFQPARRVGEPNADNRSQPWERNGRRKLAREWPGRNGVPQPRIWADQDEGTVWEWWDVKEGLGAHPEDNTECLIEATTLVNPDYAALAHQSKRLLVLPTLCQEIVDGPAKDGGDPTADFVSDQGRKRCRHYNVRFDRSAHDEEKRKQRYTAAPEPKMSNPLDQGVPSFAQVAVDQASATRDFQGLVSEKNIEKWVHLGMQYVNLRSIQAGFQRGSVFNDVMADSPEGDDVDDGGKADAARKRAEEAELQEEIEQATKQMEKMIRMQLSEEQKQNLGEELREKFEAKKLAEAEGAKRAAAAKREAELAKRQQTDDKMGMELGADKTRIVDPVFAVSLEMGGLAQLRYLAEHGRRRGVGVIVDVSFTEIGHVCSPKGYDFAFTALTVPCVWLQNNGGAMAAAAGAQAGAVTRVVANRPNWKKKPLWAAMVGFMRLLLIHSQVAGFRIQNTNQVLRDYDPSGATPTDVCQVKSRLHLKDSDFQTFNQLAALGEDGFVRLNDAATSTACWKYCARIPDCEGAVWRHERARSQKDACMLINELALEDPREQRFSPNFLGGRTQAHDLDEYVEMEPACRQVLTTLSGLAETDDTATERQSLGEGEVRRDDAGHQALDVEQMEVELRDTYKKCAALVPRTVYIAGSDDGDYAQIANQDLPPSVAGSAVTNYWECRRNCARTKGCTAWSFVQENDEEQSAGCNLLKTPGNSGVFAEKDGAMILSFPGAISGSCQVQKNPTPRNHDEGTWKASAAGADFLKTASYTIHRNYANEMAAFGLGKRFGDDSMRFYRILFLGDDDTFAERMNLVETSHADVNGGEEGSRYKIAFDGTTHAMLPPSDIGGASLSDLAGRFRQENSYGNRASPNTVLAPVRKDDELRWVSRTLKQLSSTPRRSPRSGAVVEQANLATAASSVFSDPQNRGVALKHNLLQHLLLALTRGTMHFGPGTEYLGLLKGPLFQQWSKAGFQLLWQAFAFTAGLIRLRKQYDALRDGAVWLLPAQPGTLLFEKASPSAASVFGLLRSAQHGGGDTDSRDYRTSWWIGSLSSARRYILGGQEQASAAARGRSAGALPPTLLPRHLRARILLDTKRLYAYSAARSADGERASQQGPSGGAAHASGTEFLRREQSEQELFPSAPAAQQFNPPSHAMSAEFLKTFAGTDFEVQEKLKQNLRQKSTTHFRSLFTGKEWEDLEKKLLAPRGSSAGRAARGHYDPSAAASTSTASATPAVSLEVSTAGSSGASSAETPVDHNRFGSWLPPHTHRNFLPEFAPVEECDFDPSELCVRATVEPGTAVLLSLEFAGGDVVEQHSREDHVAAEVNNYADQAEEQGDHEIGEQDEAFPVAGRDAEPREGMPFTYWLDPLEKKDCASLGAGVLRTAYVTETSAALEEQPWSAGVAATEAIVDLPARLAQVKKFCMNDPRCVGVAEERAGPGSLVGHHGVHNLWLLYGTGAGGGAARSLQLEKCSNSDDYNTHVKATKPEYFLRRAGYDCLSDSVRGLAQVSGPYQKTQWSLLQVARKCEEDPTCIGVQNASIDNNERQDALWLLHSHEDHQVLPGSSNILGACSVADTELGLVTFWEKFNENNRANDAALTDFMEANFGQEQEEGTANDGDAVHDVDQVADQLEGMNLGQQ